MAGSSTVEMETISEKQMLLISENGETEKKNKSSIYATYINYMHSIIGSGVIGMAYAMRASGWLFSTILLLIVAILTDYSLILVIKCGLLSGTRSYQDMMSKVFGMPGFIIQTFFQFIYPFVAMISYNVIVGDTITKVIIRVFNVDPSSLFVQRQFVIIMATLFVTLPLSLYRHIGKLAKSSLVGMVFVIIVLIFIIVRYFSMHATIEHLVGNVEVFTPGGVSDTLGVITFAYMCHHNSFLLYDAMEDASMDKWKKVTHASITTAFIIMLIFALAGYATFASWTQGDLLNNYCWHDDLMNFARIFFTFIVVTIYPIECFVCRVVAENTIYNLIIKGCCNGDVDKFDKIRETSLSHILYTVVIVGICCAISLTTDCLNFVQELSGLFTAIPIAFILPGCCYLKLSDSKMLSWDKMPALFLVLFGFAVVINGIFSLSIEGIPTCVGDVQLAYCQLS